MGERKTEIADDSPPCAKPRKTPWFVWLGVGALAALIVALGSLSAIEKNEGEKRREMQAEMVRFVRFLFQFEEEFGQYPCDRIAEDVQRKTGTDLPLTGASVLNQLEAYGIPKDRLRLRTSTLADGDWMYVGGMHSDSNPTWPVLITPEIGGRRQALRVGGYVTDFHSEEFGELPAHISDPVIVPKAHVWK